MFNSCQDGQMRMVKMIQWEAGASRKDLFFVPVYFVKDTFGNKETGVMRNFNLHYDLFFCLFLICSCALLS